MAQVSDCIAKLRRRINDTVSPFVYDDATLTSFVSDAVDYVELFLPRGYSVDTTTIVFARNGVDLDATSTKIITNQDITLFAAQAHYYILMEKKSSSDSSTFSMKKGRLALDNTNQPENLEKSIALVQQEVRQLIWKIKNMRGVRLE